MNLREALHILAPTYVPSTRAERQRVIETAIAEFCCDAVEASELLDALQFSLCERYGADEISDILKVMRTLHWALRDLDETQLTPETEEDIREFLADQDYGNDIDEGDFK